MKYLIAQFGLELQVLTNQDGIETATLDPRKHVNLFSAVLDEYQVYLSASRSLLALLYNWIEVCLVSVYDKPSLFCVLLCQTFSVHLRSILLELDYAYSFPILSGHSWPFS